MPKDENKSARSPSRLDGRSDSDSRGVTRLVDLGRLIHELTWPSNEAGFPITHSREQEAELRLRIKEAEDAFEQYIYLEGNSGLRRILGIVGRQVADAVAVRIIAYCSYMFLLTSNTSPSVGQVVKSAGLGDISESLEARRLLYEMTRNGDALILKDHDCHGGIIQDGGRLRRFLNGDSRSPVLFDESDIQTSNNQSALRSANRKPTGSNEADICSTPEQQPIATPSSCPSSASEIMHRMQEYVIGENIAPTLRRYCCRLAMHLQRKRMIDQGKQPDSPAESLLILGQSGSGKTHLLNATAKILDLPMASLSACDITCEGFVGLSISDAVSTVVKVSGGNPTRSRTAILHLDEWDKKKSSVGMSRDGGDVFGSSVQQGVLRLMEGQANYQVNGRRNYDGKPIQFDSRGLLYIFSGAFTELPQILQKQKRLKAGIGFGASPEKTDGMMAIRSALIEYGMIEEFVNRLTAVVALPRPSIKDLESILTAPTGVLAMYNGQFATDGMRIAMTPEARHYLAEWASENGLARGLKLVVSCLAEQIIFDRRQGLIFFDENDVAKAIDGMTSQVV